MDFRFQGSRPWSRQNYGRRPPDADYMTFFSGVFFGLAYGYDEKRNI